MQSSQIQLDAANHLVGLRLEGGWVVKSKRQKPSSATGGHFSVCYLVEHDSGRSGFLKALNLGRALSSSHDVLKEIEHLITTFNFEKATLKLCRDKKIKRVAIPLADGHLLPDGSPYPVYYIIFELAPKGDLRSNIRSFDTVDLAFTFSVLHDTASALNGLHKNSIAHQDLKPSNVLIYDQSKAKVADLGCADNLESGSPRGHLPIAGDTNYAPPELLYHEISQDWKRRRLGCDLYHLGTLAAFLFTGISVTSALISHLHQAHRPGFWSQDYRTVLPYVREAFEQAMVDIGKSIDDRVRNEMVGAIASLCDPDPFRRGHPGDAGGNQFNLERYISLFQRLLLTSEYDLFDRRRGLNN